MSQVAAHSAKLCLDCTAIRLSPDAQEWLDAMTSSRLGAMPELVVDQLKTERAGTNA
jgi:hypothetical protein